MDPVSVAVIAVLVFATAFVTANLGLGGGLLYVPILLSPLWTDDKTIAVPISLTLVLATGLASTWNHFRKGFVDPRAAVLLVPAAGLGALAGVAFNLAASRTIFLAAFVAAIVAAGIRMLQNWVRSPNVEGQDDDSRLTPARKAVSGSAAGIAGFLSSGLGIGGGIANVPILIYGLGRSPRKAIGTSSAIIVPTAIVGLAAYFAVRTLGANDFELIAILWPLVLVGAFVGSRWGLAKLRERSVALGFIVILFLAAAKFLYDLAVAL